MLKNSNKQVNEIVEYLSKTIEKMMAEKMILQNTEAQLTPQMLTDKLMKVLEESLASDREMYLMQLIRKIQLLNSDCSDLEDEYNRVKHQSHREMLKIRNENEELRIKYETLEEQIKQMQWKQEQKEAKNKRHLQQKQEALGTLHRVIDTAQSTQLAIARQIKDLRYASQKMLIGQTKVLEQTKQFCTEKLQDEITQSISKLKETEQRQIRKLSRQIEAEKAEQAKLKVACQNMLEAIWELNPEAHPDISPEDFPRRVNEVENFIDEAVNIQQKKYIHSMQSRIKTDLPDIEFDNEDVSGAVDNYIQEKVLQREAECRELLRQSENREKQIRAKLDEALSKIKRLQDNSKSDSAVLDEIIQGKDEWRQTTRKLDETMKALEDEKNSFARQSRMTNSFLFDSD